jgi:hypothetical protein
MPTMDSQNNGVLYEEVLSVTREYFGPAANRFVARQIHSHLRKDPDELGKQDLAHLIDWIRVAMALLIEDEQLVSKYVADLKRLIDTHNK